VVPILLVNSSFGWSKNSPSLAFSVHPCPSWQNAPTLTEYEDDDDFESLVDTGEGLSNLPFPVPRISQRRESRIVQVLRRFFCAWVPRMLRTTCLGP
jgi:hypothetical protein